MEYKEKERKKNISELGDTSIGTSQTGKRKKKKKKWNRKSTTCGTITKGVAYMK